jgi:hypothetical protein
VRWLAELVRRRRPRATGPEAGSAVVEFVVLAVLLMIPLIYLVMALARVQAGAFAVSMAAREAGRAYVTADATDAAEPRARAAARLAFEDQGFAEQQTRLVLACDGDPCLRPDGRVRVTASVTVPLPLVPSFAREVVPLEVPLGASHVAVADRFRAP